MKNKYYQSIYKAMRQFHLHNQWPLDNGLFIPHSYTHDVVLASSFWDDFGFILNHRRILVSWVHPRMKYMDQIKELAYSQAGELASNKLNLGKKNYKKVGRSRKKVTTICASFSNNNSDYYDRLIHIENNLKLVGIDFSVQASYSVEIKKSIKIIHLCIPHQITSKNDLFDFVLLVKRFITNQTTLDIEFPNYVYTKEDWLLDFNDPFLHPFF